MERKLATVLFVDLVGSTELVAARDPEIVRRRVNSFFEQVSHCITTHGGIVEKFAGDAVMAAFGVPQAHEDDAERAIRAAAARRARSASSSCEVGIPNAAITASPANFSTIPPCRVMHVETCSKNEVTRRRTTSGSRDETSSVEPTRSTKRTVASLRSMSQV